MFDVVGSRGTHADLGFDRFWRNVRTHTLHDPLDYKLQALGRWAVHGEEPFGPALQLSRSQKNPGPARIFVSAAPPQKR
jgi:hypothetical protein